MYRVVAMLLLVASATVQAEGKGYYDTIAEWGSPEDVAFWLEANFTFDKDRQKQIQKRLKSQGPSGLLVKNAEDFFGDSRGYCGDSANFIYQTLNEIDFMYEPSWVFIKNSVGRPNHWVIAFKDEGKIYIMDYGTGDKWKAMQGIHGPYNTLSEYRDYLESLTLPGFGVANVRYRTMPGSED